MKVFVACTRKLTDKEVEETKRELKTCFSAYPDVEIVDSGEEYHKSFHLAGGWEQWTTRIASGLDYSTRQPNFDVFVVTEKKIGRATALILFKVLNTQKPVVYMEKGEFWRVSKVTTMNDNDWQNGWELRFS